LCWPLRFEYPHVGRLFICLFVCVFQQESVSKGKLFNRKTSER
jgi:hypothetical protein